MDYTRILNVAKEYVEKHDLRNARFIEWNTIKADYTKKILVEISNEIVENNEWFKSNLYVDEVKANMKSDSGKLMSSNPMRTVILRSGAIPVLSYTSEDSNSKRSIVESGFQLHFGPTINGKINVLAFGHSIENESEVKKSIKIIDHPKDIDDEIIIKCIIEAFEFFKTTSYLFK